MLLIEKLPGDALSQKVFRSRETRLRDWTKDRERHRKGGNRNRACNRNDA